MKKGRAGTMTHDYKRNGTTTLFAALDVLEGTVIGRNMQRHHPQEFIQFLNAIEAEVPAGKLVHVILDNYAAHKHPKVRSGSSPAALHLPLRTDVVLVAQRRSRASSPNLGAKLRARRHPTRLRTPDHHQRFVEETNQMPKPFDWAADSPTTSSPAVRRGHQLRTRSTSP